jgi:Golgi phosphoprotein 3 (GPP34)
VIRRTTAGGSGGDGHVTVDGSPSSTGSAPPDRPSGCRGVLVIDRGSRRWVHLDPHCPLGRHSLPLVPARVEGTGSRVVLTLADSLFLIGWGDQPRGPRLHRRALGVGLAGAVVGELMLSGLVDVGDRGVLDVRHGTAPDRVTGEALDAMVGHPQHATLDVWLEVLGQTSLELVGGRLAVAGLLARRARRVVRGLRVEFEATDRVAAAWPAVRLAEHLTRGSGLPESDRVLVALVRACGLLPHVLWDPSTAAAGHERVASVLAGLARGHRALADEVAAAVAKAALAAR